jgi:hypothetical protein
MLHERPELAVLALELCISLLERGNAREKLLHQRGKFLDRRSAHAFTNARFAIGMSRLSRGLAAL